MTSTSSHSNLLDRTGDSWRLASISPTIWDASIPCACSASVWLEEKEEASWDTSSESSNDDEMGLLEWLNDCTLSSGGGRLFVFLIESYGMIHTTVCPFWSASHLRTLPTHWRLSELHAKFFICVSWMGQYNTFFLHFFLMRTSWRSGAVGPTPRVCGRRISDARQTAAHAPWASRLPHSSSPPPARAPSPPAQVGH